MEVELYQVIIVFAVCSRKEVYRIIPGVFPKMENRNASQDNAIHKNTTANCSQNDNQT